MLHVRAVLEVGVSAELRTPSLHGMLSAYRDPKQIDRLRDVLMGLHDGWVERAPDLGAPRS
jgi:hypothetical protein